MVMSQLKTLETVEGSEDSVLKVLLELASVEGLSLPECCCAVVAETTSVLSLHIAVDSGEEVADATWNQLCALLRIRFIERLKQLSEGPGTGCERRQLVGSLQAVFPRTIVVSQYRSIRQLQLDSCIDRYLYPEGDRKLDFAASVEGFRAAMDDISAMMASDFELTVTGCLTDDLDEAFQLLGDVYFDRVQDEVALLVHKLTA